MRARSVTAVSSVWSDLLSNTPNLPDVKENVRLWARQIDQQSIGRIMNLYGDIEFNIPNSIAKVSQRSENLDRNRYYDIQCLDRTRVILTFPSTSTNDYIHANHVTNDVFKNRFIITQGPVGSTIDDFWRLIWQENCRRIVMLCDYVEDRYSKCERYFSQNHNSTREFLAGGAISVKTIKIDENHRDGITTTELLVTHGGESRNVMHYQFKNWPDDGVPSTSIGVLFGLLKTVRGSANPVVVHCSAGIGRSGTLVALEQCILELFAGRRLDIPAVVTSLRSHRAYAVQTVEQFVFLYEAVLDFAVQNDFVDIAFAERFRAKVREMPPRWG